MMYMVFRQWIDTNCNQQNIRTLTTSLLRPNDPNKHLTSSPICKNCKSSWIWLCWLRPTWRLFRQEKTYSRNPSKLALILHTFRGAFQSQNSCACTDKMPRIIICVKPAAHTLVLLHGNRERESERDCKKLSCWKDLKWTPTNGRWWWYIKYSCLLCYGQEKEEETFYAPNKICC
jgi:hypothetical protein